MRFCVVLEAVQRAHVQELRDGQAHLDASPVAARHWQPEQVVLGFLAAPHRQQKLGSKGTLNQ